MNQDGEYSGERTVSGLAGWLKREIQSGSFSVGQALPPLRTAAVRWRMNRNSVQKAYSLLAAWGHVTAQSGGGTVVRSRTPERELLDWPRFWWPASNQEPPARFREFLWDPGESGIINRSVQTLESLADKPVIVLLGEAGLGKSTALRQYFNTLNAQQPGSAVLIDLATVGSVGELRVQLDRFLKRTKAGVKPPVTLLVDGLDEGRLRDPLMHKALYEWMGPQSKNGLRIRIACRTNAWTGSLEADLSAAVELSEVPVFTLLELRQKDVLFAAVRRGLNADMFMSAITSQRLTHLAARPISLFFLLDAAMSSDLKRTSVQDIVQNGIEHLLIDPDEPRVPRGAYVRLDRSQRMRLASQLAAVSVLCNRPTIIDGRTAMSSSDSIEPDDMNSLPAQAGAVRATAETFAELLTTPLFIPDGNGRFRFAHRSFAEFLAAWYLKNTPDEASLERLLFVRSAGSSRVPQGLRETAAWLATMRPSFSRLLADAEPETLMLSDSAQLSDDQRAELVASFLERIEGNAISWERIRGVEDLYHRLRHPGLSAQLQTVITSRDRLEKTREVAIDIAQHCGLRDVASILIDLILDTAEPIQLRVGAAYALRWLGREDESQPILGVERLRSLALGDKDLDQELLGCILHSLWPVHLSADELFEILVPEKQPNLYGAYASFLTTSELVDGLDVSDLPKALQWASRHPHRERTFRHAETTCDNILLKAWEHLDSPAIRDAALPIFAARLVFDRNLIGDPWKWSSGRKDESTVQSPERRRLLLEGLVEYMCAHAKDEGERDISAWRLLHCEPTLLTRSDFEWILHQACTCNEELQGAWVELANRLALQAPADSWSASELVAIVGVLDLADRPVRLLDFLLPVELDSPHAAELRANFKEMKRYGRPRRKRRNGHTVRQVMENWLGWSEKGYCDTWFGIHELLVFGYDWDEPERGGSSSGGVLSAKLWKSADQKLRERILESARQFVVLTCPRIEHPLQSTSWNGASWVALDALRLLMREAPSFFEGPPPPPWTSWGGWWRAWAPLVVALRDFSGNATEEIDIRLATAAYAHAPDACRISFSRLLEGDTSKDREETTLERFDECADSAFQQTLCSFLADIGPVGPDQLRSVLAFVIEHEEGSNARSRELAARFISDNSADERSRSLSIAAAQTSAMLFHDAGWDLLWTRMQSDATWGRDVLAGLTHRPWRSGGDFYTRLTPTGLADLVVWLWTTLPLGDVPDRTAVEAYTPTIGEELSRWREAAMAELVERGGAEGERAFQHLITQFPNNTWFRERLIHLRDRAVAWTPMDPRTLADLLEDPTKRLATSGEDLLDVVCDSLARFEGRIQNQDSPLRANLWNTDGAKPRPKDENHVSDNLRDHLFHDLVSKGVVANREVQILHPKKLTYGEKGKRLDIKVEAISGNGPSRTSLTVVVEVKLDTNPHVLSDLNEQLIRRYLNESHRPWGVYLVGWTGTKPRWREPRLLQAELAKQLNEITPHSPVRIVVINCSLTGGGTPLAMAHEPSLAGGSLGA